MTTTTPTAPPPALSGLTPERIELIQIAVSSYYGLKKNPLGNGSSYLMRALREYAATTVAGGKSPVSFDAEDLPRPDPKAVLKRRGVTKREVREEFGSRRRQLGDKAHLDLDLLLDLLPAPYWQIISVLIDEGPARASQRIEIFVSHEVERVLPPTRARPEGGFVSQGHIDNLTKNICQLMEMLIDLRAREVSADLDAWVGRPRMNLPPAKIEQATDTTAPPLALLRQVLAQLDEEIEAILGCPAEEQAEEIRRKLTKRQQHKLFYRLRTRALVALLATVGMRVDALSRLQVQDIIRSRRRLDGLRESGPAIALRPAKSINEDLIRYKPIPQSLLERIDAFHAYAEAVLGHPLEPDNPVLFPDMKNYRRPLTDAAIRSKLGQSSVSHMKLKDGSVKSYKSPPILPREDSEAGYAPHTVRGATAQMIRSQPAADWLEAHRGELADDRLASTTLLQSMIADVLLDHQVKMDQLGYGGGHKEQDRERLSGLGTEIAWSLLSSDLGARKVPDEEGFRRALHQRLAAESELERIEKGCQEAFAASHNGTPAEEALLKVQELTARERKISEQLAEIKTEIKAIRHDPARLVSIPDGEPLPQIDLDRVEREVLGGTGDYERRRYKPIRDWITPAELAGIHGVGSATVRRWIEGRLPRGFKPWDPAHSPVDESLGEKRRRLAVDRLSPQLFDTELKREELAATLARLPKGWSQEAFETPLTLR